MNSILLALPIVLGALVVAHFAGAWAVRRAVAPYIEAIGEINKGLPNAGQLIGQLERFLIVLFVITGNVTGVGFLLTAKSVFRYGDIKDDDTQRRTEYYLIGSLASFTFAIVVGFAARLALHQLGIELLPGAE